MVLQETAAEVCDRLADQYAACVESMKKVSMGPEGCNHIRQKLVWCVAEHACPRETEFLMACLKNNQRSPKTPGHACLSQYTRLEVCMSSKHVANDGDESYSTAGTVKTPGL